MDEVNNEDIKYCDGMMMMSMIPDDDEVTVLDDGIMTTVKYRYSIVHTIQIFNFH